MFVEDKYDKTRCLKKKELRVIEIVPFSDSPLTGIY